MSDTHTPGPWGLETVRTSCGVCHKIGPWPHKWRAGEEMSACIYDDYPSPPEGTDTMLANARLIAAAPALLEALELGVAELRVFAALLHDESTRAAINANITKIEAAIAAARGAA